MNYAESFEQFASRVTTMDLALYAGVGLVLYVLFKDKLSPVQAIIKNLLDSLKGFTSQKNDSPIVVVKPSPNTTTKNIKEDLFFQLVQSWKQTRDLAVSSGCSEAVKVADQMFPYLSPQVCNQEENHAQ